jgi:hypothetical protein
MAAIYFLFHKENGKEPFRRTMLIFATLLFAGATMMTCAGIRMDQIVLVDSQVNTSDPNGAVQSLDSQVLLDRVNLFLTAAYITTNFIADLLIVRFTQILTGLVAELFM